MVEFFAYLIIGFMILVVVAVGVAMILGVFAVIGFIVVLLLEGIKAAAKNV